MIRLQEYTAACRTYLLAALLAIGTCFAFAPSTSDAAVAIPINQGAFNGTFTITNFSKQTVNGVTTLVAEGILQGTQKKGKTLNAVIADVVTPVTVTAQECEILHLDLGPLDLNLLGLKIDLSEIVLDITAVPGPGALLGNLLCDVAHLLDPNSIDQLVVLLNNLLNVLENLLG